MKLSVLTFFPLIFYFTCVSRLSSKEPPGLPPLAGLPAAFPRFSAGLPASSHPADDMGEGSGQFLPLGVDCPVDGPGGYLCLAKTSTCPKAILFIAGDGMIFNIDSSIVERVASLIHHAYGF